MSTVKVVHTLPAATKAMAEPMLVAALAGSAEEATKLASLIKAEGVYTVDALNIIAAVEEAINKAGKAGASARAGACNLVSAICKDAAAGLEPFIFPVFAQVIDLIGDKEKIVQTAAAAAGDALIKLVSPNAVRSVMPAFLMKSQKWQSAAFRLKSITFLAKHAPIQIARVMPDIIPFVSSQMWDLKKEVKSAAKEALLAVCDCVENTDIKPFVPQLIKSIENPKEVPETLYLLASTTFVQVVESGALSIISPLLERGFMERGNTVAIRQCARIIENMTKLVEEPRDIAPFLPKLLPKLEIAKEEVSDPECREVCGKGAAILTSKGEQAAANKSKLNNFDHLYKAVLEISGVATPNATFAKSLAFFTHEILMLTDIKVFEEAVWKTCLTNYLVGFVADLAAAEKIITDILAEVIKDVTPEVEIEDDGGAEELCNCQFRLAYGSKILLSNTSLKLLRGFRYGVLGKNDCGKTSLLRAIADHRLEGFPTEDELRTVFVATDIQGEDTDMLVLDYIFADPLLADSGITREQMAKTLHEVGFNPDAPADITSPVGSLSGGWKMKLALSRAMLLKADIILLDEPTNHLDAYNVKWVESYLTGLVGVTCIMVSHDSGFLDRVCTHIIEIKDLKLHTAKGNLTTFLANRPDAHCYFEFKTTGNKLPFKFPTPGVLEGINTKGKPLMKMTDITFTYPGASKAQLRGVTIRCSLASRVACVGVNGAGKSTMIKLLTGELVPDEGSGEVWKHPNARVAYVAQHAFHHIENHLDLTANEYILWRYQYGKDKEGLEKVTMRLNAEELIQFQKPIVCLLTDEEGNTTREKRVIEKFTEGRRQKGKELEYEILWENNREPTWVNMEYLLKQGVAFDKMIKQTDEAIANSANAYSRPLTQVNVEDHLEGFGLEREFGTHTRIRALSGGQKVKVVLAAAMWNCPHLLILDEPTNYLDRESLSQLADAIRVFEGGVVMITHNNAFCEELCPEVWHLENNTLNLKGDAEWMEKAMKEKIEVKKDGEKEAMKDRYGNDVKVKEKKKKLSRAELKKKEKLKKARKAMGLASEDEDDSDFDDL